MSCGSKKRPDTLDLQVINSRQTPVTHQCANKSEIKAKKKLTTCSSDDRDNVRVASCLQRWLHGEPKTNNNKDTLSVTLMSDGGETVINLNETVLCADDSGDKIRTHKNLLDGEALTSSYTDAHFETLDANTQMDSKVTAESFTIEPANEPQQEEGKKLRGSIFNLLNKLTNRNKPPKVVERMRSRTSSGTGLGSTAEVSSYEDASQSIAPNHRRRNNVEIKTLDDNSICNINEIDENAQHITKDVHNRRLSRRRRRSSYYFSGNQLSLIYANKKCDFFLPNFLDHLFN